MDRVPFAGGTLNYFAARHVALVPSGGGTIRYLTKDPNIPLDVFRGGNSFAWSPDGKALYYQAGHGARDYLVRQNVSTGTIERLTDRAGSAPSFTLDLARGVFLKAAGDRPSEVVLLEGGRESRTFTDAGAQLSQYLKAEPSVVTWKSRDGLPIEGSSVSAFRVPEGPPGSSAG